MTRLPLEFPFVRAASEPGPIIGTPRYIVGAMMTASHFRLGDRLASSCRTFGLPLALFEVPCVHRSISKAGSDDPRFTKANFIQFLLRRYRRPVLYLDVDCVVAQPPILFDGLPAAGVDFAIFNWFAEEHTEAYAPASLDAFDQHRPIPHRFYRFSHSIDMMSDTQLCCSGAVQWYQDTPASRGLLDAWQKVIERAPGRADDKCLDLAFNNYPPEGPKLKTIWLEKRYARYAWWIYERPVIDHPEFPSPGAGFAPLDAVDGKPRFHMHLLREGRVNYVFPKDSLIDTEARVLLRQQDGTWRSAGPIGVPLWLPHGDKAALSPDAESAVTAKFGEALALHQAARYDEAESAYQQVLERRPRHVQALTFSGVLAFQGQRFDRALELTTRALEADPLSIAGLLMRGHILARLRRYEEAIVSYDEAIALKSDFTEGYIHRGNALAELRRHAAAVSSYDAALRLDAYSAEILNNRGNSLRALKQYEAAIASYDSAIGVAPRVAVFHFNRGLALFELSRHEAALSSFDKAISIEAGYAEAHVSRGNALRQLGRREAALASYDRAIAIKPEYAQAHSNRGNVLSELEHFDAALASHDIALSLDERSAEFHCNRGNLFVELRRYDDARICFDAAVDIDPAYAPAYLGRSFLFLLLGDLEHGWRDFEWRWKNEYGITSQERRVYAQPEWLGQEVLVGKTILLYCEQGLGDTIQFCRYAEVVAAMGAQVIFEAPKPLHGLLRSLRGVAHLIAQGDPVPPFDYTCPLMSLPLALNARLDNLPATVPYLRIGGERAGYWRDRLGPRNKPRVGLVWSGGFRPGQPELWAVNNRRNIPLARLAALEDTGIEFYSLQKGEPAESELTELVARQWEGPTLFNFVDELHDFEDTAALIDQLDLVISVDTSTLHLAGALGKPVWLLNRYDTCWRWLLERSDSPWYPTLRIYRQDRPGDWDGVVQRVRRDLERLAD